MVLGWLASGPPAMPSRPTRRAPESHDGPRLAHLGALSTGSYAARPDGAPADCVTGKTMPATVIAPLRAGPRLAATLYRTTPMPLPVAPDVTVSHGALDTAVHPQPVFTVTSVAPAPPSLPIEALPGETLYV